MFGNRAYQIQPQLLPRSLARYNYSSVCSCGLRGCPNRGSFLHTIGFPVLRFGNAIHDLAEDYIWDPLFSKPPEPPKPEMKPFESSPSAEATTHTDENSASKPQAEEKIHSTDD